MSREDKWRQPQWLVRRGRAGRAPQSAEPGARSAGPGAAQRRRVVGLALGLRQGEALGLWWEDVDLPARVLRVRRALQRQRGGGLVFTAPITARSRRTVPLPAQLVHALEDHKEQQDKERAAAGSLWRGSLCVFTTPVGTPVDPRNDYREFKKLLGRAGLPSVRLHDLRHTAASLLVAQGVPPRVVMEILGHSQIALTMNTYSHVAPEVSREAADRMAETLWQDAEDQADEREVAELEDRQEDGE
jgi:integrase